MGFDPQPLVDGEMDAITSYVTNQPSSSSSRATT